MSSVPEMMFALAVAMGCTGLAIDGVVKIAPKPQMADYFVVNTISATRDGDTAKLAVSREIHQPVTQGFVVRVMAKVDGGWRQFCQMEAAPFEYQPDAVMPETVTLDWWTYGKCSMLPDGPAQIITTWTPVSPRGLLPLTYKVEIPG